MTLEGHLDDKTLNKVACLMLKAIMDAIFQSDIGVFPWLDMSCVRVGGR